MTRKRAAVCAVLVVALGGCAVDQVKEVAAYREPLALGEPPVYSAGEPMSLETAVLLTNHQNELLSIEGENYLRALIERQRATAAFLPTIDLVPSLLLSENVGEGGMAGGDGIDGGGEGGGARDTAAFDTAIQGRVTLFDGFRNVNRLRAVDAVIDQRLALLLDVRESLLLDVAQVYYRVLRAERLVAVLENSLAVQEERVRDVRGRQEVGLARPLDIAQTEAQASDTRVQLVNAETDVRNARTALEFLTGAAVGTAPLSDGFAVPDEVPDRTAFVRMARTMRTDLAAAEAGARAARAEVDVAIGQYAPSVSLNADYFLLRETSPSDLDWTALVEINLPIFSGGRIEADVREGWSGFRQAVLAHSLVRRQVRQDIGVAHENVLASRRRLEELRFQIRAAEEAVRQADASYRAGLATNLERITAQDQLLNAQLQMASEEYDLKIFYLALLRSAGGLTEGTTGVRVPVAEIVDDPPTSPFIVVPEPPGLISKQRDGIAPAGRTPSYRGRRSTDRAETRRNMHQAAGVRDHAGPGDGRGRRDRLHPAGR